MLCRVESYGLGKSPRAEFVLFRQPGLPPLRVSGIGGVRPGINVLECCMLFRLGFSSVRHADNAILCAVWFSFSPDADSLYRRKCHICYIAPVKKNFTILRRGRWA